MATNAATPSPRDELALVIKNLARASDVIEEVAADRDSPLQLATYDRWALDGFTNDALVEAELIVERLVWLREWLNGGVTAREQAILEVVTRDA